MSETEIAKANKKIIVRFLKETGILMAWKEYTGLRSPKMRQKIYHKSYVDDVFNCTTFTRFLRENKGLIQGTSITSIFRAWYLAYQKINAPGFTRHLYTNYVYDKGDFKIINNRVVWKEGYGFKQKKD